MKKATINKLQKDELKTLLVKMIYELYSPSDIPSCYEEGDIPSRYIVKKYYPKVLKLFNYSPQKSKKP